MKKRDISGILIRYLILVLIALPNLALFYFIFTPLTIYPVHFLLNLLYDVSVSKNIIQIGDVVIKIIPACVAGSAYYLLTVLSLSMPRINIKKRLSLLLTVFLVFLIINILRISLLSAILVSGSPLFDITHKIFWYLGSIIFVIAIWFFSVKAFKIKEIPFYSDLKLLYKKTKLK